MTTCCGSSSKYPVNDEFSIGCSFNNGNQKIMEKMHLHVRMYLIPLNNIICITTYISKHLFFYNSSYN